MMKSLGLTDHDVFIDDNEMYNFPILYYGRKAEKFTDHFPISASVISMEPTGPEGGQSGHLLIAALPTLLRDYYIRKVWADRMRGMFSIMQKRFLISQMYVGGATAARYALRLDPTGSLSVKNVRKGASDDRVPTNPTLAHNLKGTPFMVPPFPLLRVSSSYHYAGGFRFGNNELAIGSDCQVFPGCYLCDSAVFPQSPAQPLTFTIMANAMRVAHQALG